MVELAIAGNPAFELSTIEVDRAGPSFTVDTVEALTAHPPGATLHLILSAETFAELPTWHEPERLFAAARMAVVPREGYPAPDPAWLAGAFPGREDRVDYLEGPRLGLSSTAIRGRVAAGRSIRYLVPPAVEAYIADHNLYRRGSLPSDRPRSQPVRTPEAREPPCAKPAQAAAPEMPALDLARRIVELAEDKKAADIMLLDLTGLTTVADYFVIASGGSERQLDAIADGIISGMRDEKIHAFGREGTAASHWVLVDFGSVIVHIFTPPERDYYSLERHWSEAKTILRLQ